jgi:hypothetical protein
MVRQTNWFTSLLVILLLTATVGAAASPSLNLTTGQQDRPTELYSRTLEASSPAENGARATHYRYAPIAPYSSAVASAQITSMSEVPMAMHSMMGHHNGWLMAGVMIAMMSIMLIAVMH